MRDMAIVIQINGGEPRVTCSNTQVYDYVALASMTGEALYETVSKIAHENEIDVKKLLDLVIGYMEMSYVADYELDEE